ncbi:MAG: hypothetical protein VCA36_12890 [Opitutales bacterium]
MKHLSKLYLILFTPLIMMLASCVSNNTQSRSLANRTEAAEEAFENDSLDKAELLKVLLETDIERGRLAYHKTRYLMARSQSSERLHDPPRHYRHREMLKKAHETKAISEQEYVELSELGDKAHNAWLARRRKVTRDRAIWGFPH